MIEFVSKSGQSTILARRIFLSQRQYSVRINALNDVIFGTHRRSTSIPPLGEVWDVIVSKVDTNEDSHQFLNLKSYDSYSLSN